MLIIICKYLIPCLEHLGAERTASGILTVCSFERITELKAAYSSGPLQIGFVDKQELHMHTYKSKHTHTVAAHAHKHMHSHRNTHPHSSNVQTV